PSGRRAGGEKKVPPASPARKGDPAARTIPRQATAALASGLRPARRRSQAWPLGNAPGCRGRRHLVSLPIPIPSPSEGRAMSDAPAILSPLWEGVRDETSLFSFNPCPAGQPCCLRCVRWDSELHPLRGETGNSLERWLD